MCAMYGLLSAPGKWAATAPEAMLGVLTSLTKLHPDHPRLLHPGSADLLDEALRRSCRLAHPDGFVDAVLDHSLPPRFQRAGEALEEWTRSLLEAERRGSFGPEEAGVINRFILRGRELTRRIERDLLGDLARVRGLLGGGGDRLPAESWRHGWTLSRVLEAMERLEAGAHEAAGLAVYAHFAGAEALQRFLDMERVAFRPHASPRTLLFTYQGASRNGHGEDHFPALRELVLRDSFLQRTLRQPGTTIQVLAHTSWGRNGSIFSGSDGSIVAVLDGEVQNRRELLRRRPLDPGPGAEQPAADDAQLIPRLISSHYRQSRDLEAAFRAALEDLEGSLTVAIMAADRPGELLLGRKGNGPGLYLGLAATSAAVTSESDGLGELACAPLEIGGDRVRGGEFCRVFTGEHGMEAATMEEDGPRPVPPTRILDAATPGAGAPGESKAVFPVVKYESLAPPVHVPVNRRKAKRLSRTLGKNLDNPITAENIQEIRDRIYFKVEKRGEAATGGAIAISGVTGGEGVTAVSLLLAMSLGKLKRNRVLYVDGRFDRESFAVYHDLFGLREVPLEWGNGFGFLSCHAAKDRNLYFLGGRGKELETVEFFSDGEVPALLSELKTFFDFVIFDMPPFLKRSETRLFLPKVDHFFLVCVPGKSRFADIERCKGLVGEVGGKISGVLINRQKIPLWARWIGRETFT